MYFFWKLEYNPMIWNHIHLTILLDLFLPCTSLKWQLSASLHSHIFPLLKIVVIIITCYYSRKHGSKLTFANSQNASDFDWLRVWKISTSKRLQVWKHLERVCWWSHQLVEKILQAKLCKWAEKLTSFPAKCSHALGYC